MKPFSGTSLTDRDLTTGEALVSMWHVKSDYHWDTGVAIGTYLEGLKQGPDHGHPVSRMPPHSGAASRFCELCFRPLNDWVELSDTGRVNTYSVSYVNWDASRRSNPEVPAVIEIDGASPGMGILHLVGEAGDSLEDITSRLRLGTPLQAVWKSAAEREGAVTDIRYFRPTG